MLFNYILFYYILLLRVAFLTSHFLSAQQPNRIKMRDLIIASRDGTATLVIPHEDGGGDLSLYIGRSYMIAVSLRESVYRNGKKSPDWKCRLTLIATPRCDMITRS